MVTETLQLAGGKMSIRAIPAEAFTEVETLNKANPSQALANYVFLIGNAAEVAQANDGATIPADQSIFDYLWDAESDPGRWKIVRTLYEISGRNFPAVAQGRA